MSVSKGRERKEERHKERQEIRVREKGEGKRGGCIGGKKWNEKGH